MWGDSRGNEQGFDQSFATAVQGDRIAVEMSGALTKVLPRLCGGIAVEMSRALTKVLPRLCGGNNWGLLYIGKKGHEMRR